MATYRFECPARKRFGVWDVTGGGNDWESPTIVKSRRVKQYDLAPGWYRFQSVDRLERVTCPHCGHTSDGIVNEWFAVTPAGEREDIPAVAAEYATVIVTGPLPGEPGTWNGKRCKCGKPVEGYTPDGFPYCGDHTPEAARGDTPGRVPAAEVAI